MCNRGKQRTNSTKVEKNRRTPETLTRPRLFVTKWNQHFRALETASTTRSSARREKKRANQFPYQRPQFYRRGQYGALADLIETCHAQRRRML